MAAASTARKGEWQQRRKGRKEEKNEAGWQGRARKHKDVLVRAVSWETPRDAAHLPANSTPYLSAWPVGRPQTPPGKEGPRTPHPPETGKVGHFSSFVKLSKSGLLKTFLRSAATVVSRREAPHAGSPGLDRTPRMGQDRKGGDCAGLRPKSGGRTSSSQEEGRAGVAGPSLPPLVPRGQGAFPGHLRGDPSCPARARSVELAAPGLGPAAAGLSRARQVGARHKGGRPLGL